LKPLNKTFVALKSKKLERFTGLRISKNKSSIKFSNFFAFSEKILLQFFILPVRIISISRGYSAILIGGNYGYWCA
jgi:hypothetical protein